MDVNATRGQGKLEKPVQGFRSWLWAMFDVVTSANALFFCMGWRQENTQGVCCLKAFIQLAHFSHIFIYLLHIIKNNLFRLHENM